MSDLNSSDSSSKKFNTNDNSNDKFNPNDNLNPNDDLVMTTLL